MVSLEKLTTQKKALFLAYDQGLEHGPSDFDDESVDPEYILTIGVEGGFNAVIFQKGVAEKYYTKSKYQPEIPLILKLNGKTNLLEGADPYSPLLCTVDEAISLGATAVGYTIYVGSEFESNMIREFAEVVRDAHAKDIPVMAWMYPRGKAIQDKPKEEIASYAARMGLELGADIVKTYYPGSKESLKKLVMAAGKTKVVISGGKKETEEEFVAFARLVMESGAMGMAVGRNIWQHKDPLSLTKELKSVIFGS